MADSAKKKSRKEKRKENATVTERPAVVDGDGKSSAVAGDKSTPPTDPQAQADLEAKVSEVKRQEKKRRKLRRQEARYSD